MFLIGITPPVKAGYRNPEIPICFARIAPPRGPTQLPQKVPAFSSKI
jgi:hypothetical protein